MYAYAEAIVETVREPLIILDKDLRVKSANKGFIKTFNTTKSETVGKYFYDLGNGQWNIQRLSYLLDEILPKKRSIEGFEVEHSFPQIGEKVMLLNARCVTLSEYRTELILVAIEDITERKIAEKRTEKFISMASHELRTPITSITVFMQILEKKLRDGLDKPTAQILSRVMQQLNVLNDLIKDLFDARKIKEGTLETHLRKMKIFPVIEDTIKNFQYTTDSHKILLSGKTESKVSIDKNRIIQVFTNLLINAVKYSPGKDVIKVKIVDNDNNVVVSVKDYGDGISKKSQKDIFNAYYADRKTGKKTGLGLGLYICSEIINLHKGKIWLDSKVNKGTTFYFSIPKTK